MLWAPALGGVPARAPGGRVFEERVEMGIGARCAAHPGVALLGCLMR